LNDPADPLQPLLGEIKMGSADDPQWQCGLGKHFWGGFQGMPFHCQMKSLLNAGNKLPWEEDVTTILKFTPFTDSPVNVPDGMSPTAIDKSSLAANMMKRTLTSTSKKDKKIAHDDPEIGTVGEVEVKAPLLEIDMSDTGVISVADSIDDNTLNALRSNLDTLMKDETCGKFINAVINNLSKTKTLSTGLIIDKFEGTIQENFDRIKNLGGFWVADINDRGWYFSQTIWFGRNYFKPEDTSTKNYMIDANMLYIVVDKKYAGKGYDISGKLATVFALVHELIHGYYPRKTDGNLSGHIPVAHEDMARAAEKALKELGINSIMKSDANPSTYFDAALTQACGKVKL